MDPPAFGLVWDNANIEKCQSHGVSIAEIDALFLQPFVVFPDPDHSGKEERFKAIGVGAQGRHIFIVFTLRKRGHETFIRPISARYMHKKEIKHYEEQAKTEKASGAQNR